MGKWRRIWTIVAVIVAMTLFINGQPVSAQSGTNPFQNLRPGVYKGKITFEVVDTTTMNQKGVMDATVLSFSQYEGIITIYVNKLQVSPEGALTGKPILNIETDLYAIQGYYNRIVNAEICRSDWYANSTYYVAKNQAYEVLSDEGFGTNQNFVLPLTITSVKIPQNTFTTSCPAPTSPSEAEANMADWLRRETAWFPAIELKVTEGSDLYVAGSCDFQTPNNPTLGWNGQGNTNGVSYNYHTVNCHWGAIEDTIRNRMMGGTGGAK